MTAYLAVLIFAVAYPLVALIAWCCGGYWIGVNMSEVRVLAAKERSRRSSYSADPLRMTLLARWSVVLLVGAFWPIGVPMWTARFIGSRRDKGTAQVQSLGRAA